MKEYFILPPPATFSVINTHYESGTLDSFTELKIVKQTCSK